MNRENRVGSASIAAVVDHFLRATLNLRVAALHRVEVELGSIGARSHRGSSTAAHADPHSRAADLNQQGSGRIGDLVGLSGRDCAQAASTHDRLVVAAAHASNGLFKDSEEAAQTGASELIVEGRCSQWASGHDL